MRITLFLLLAFVAVTTSARAQQQQLLDVIHLTDGSTLEGVITHVAQDEYVVLRIPDVGIRSIAWNEIAKMERKDPTESSPALDMKKMMLYDQEKKSPGTAYTLAAFLPSIGHLYAGEFGIGLLFLGGEVLCTVLAVNGIKEETVWYNGAYTGNLYSSTQMEITSAYWIGLAGLLVLRVWEIFDAGAAAKRYNRQLLKDIESNQYQITIAPTRGSGLQLSLSYAF